jgi:hypothetical protein
MNRRLLVVALTVGLASAILIASHITSTPAQPPASPLAKAAKTPPSPLPVAQVVLFSSGVGYFQREGEIEGDTRIDLTFRADDINDLLKSLVLQDQGGGKVGAIGYDSPEPVTKTLRSFALDLTGNPTFGEILNQARGQKIEATLAQTSNAQSALLTGVIVGMEAHMAPGGNEEHLLNLSCAEGMRSIPLPQVQRVRFLDPVIENDFRRALEVLAGAHDMQKKAVSLSFSGAGRRSVRVGYVTENPIWKTSYRLVLTKDGKVFLQGWAAVENTTDEDWKNVRMALVSGRPISFQMDLHTPLFVPRPTVEMERFASLRPPVYNGAIFNARPNMGVGGGIIGGLGVAGFGGGLGAAGGGFGKQPGEEDEGPNGRLYAGAINNLNRYQVPRSPQLLADLQGETVTGRLSYEALQERLRNMRQEKDRARKIGAAIAELDPREGVDAIASATSIGDYYQYRIEEPVTLSRQKSALLPIVNEDIQGSRVSIFNESVHAKFPLLGLRFKNTTNLPLTQGPITVYEGGSYAGDARIMDLQPGDERLISYAVDQGIEVKAEGASRPQEWVAVKINKGTLEKRFKLRETKTYVVKNRSKQERTLLIEHPIRSEWKLAGGPKPKEESRDYYRFELTVPAGGTVKQEVAEELPQEGSRYLSALSEEEMVFCAKHAVSSAAVKEALEKAIELRRRVDEAKSEVANQGAQLEALNADQARLRANLKETPASAAAYKRYVDKLDNQEIQIEQIQDRLRVSSKTARERLKEYETFLNELTVE